MTTAFTKQQVYDFRSYEKVRLSGKWNMLSPQAQHAAGLTRERMIFVMEHFTALRLASKEEAA